MEKNTWRRGVSVALILGITIGGSAFAGCKKKGDYVHGKKGYYAQSENGAGTEVMNQGTAGNCWAHAILTSARSASLIESGKEIPFQVEDIVMGTYGASKQEGMIAKDPGVEKNIGGSTEVATWGLSNGVGDYVMTECAYLSESFITEMNGVETGLLKNVAAKEEVQELIRNKAAVCAVLKSDAGHGQNHGYFYVYDDSHLEWNGETVYSSAHFQHMLVLVGWDDNYPKEYFGSEYGRETPKEDGAWLAQDSAGAEYGNDGLLWISYESAMAIYSYTVFSDKYSDVLSYDAGAPLGIRVPDETGETVMANVYHHKGTLSAVGTYVGLMDDIRYDGRFGRMSDTHITIEIRDADLKNVLATKECEFKYDGYYVVDLDAPVDVENFAVVVRYKDTAPIEAIDPHLIPTGDEERDANLHESAKLKYVTTIEEGQSFVFVNGQWLDMADPSAADEMGLLFEPHNACIKALFIG